MEYLTESREFEHLLQTLETRNRARSMPNILEGIVISTPDQEGTNDASCARNSLSTVDGKTSCTSLLLPTPNVDLLHGSDSELFPKCTGMGSRVGARERHSSDNDTIKSHEEDVNDDVESFILLETAAAASVAAAAAATTSFSSFQMPPAEINGNAMRSSLRRRSSSMDEKKLEVLSASVVKRRDLAVSHYEETYPSCPSLEGNPPPASPARRRFHLNVASPRAIRKKGHKMDSRFGRGFSQPPTAAAAAAAMAGSSGYARHVLGEVPLAPPPPSAMTVAAATTPAYNAKDQRVTSKSELFDLINKLQSARLDDQRCLLPSALAGNASGAGTAKGRAATAAASSSDSSSSPLPPTKNPASKQLLREALQHPPPYPMVALPRTGGYWVDPAQPDPDAPGDSRREPRPPGAAAFETDESVRGYRAHFLGYEHYNFVAIDDEVGPVVISLKTYSEQVGTAAGGGGGGIWPAKGSDEQGAQKNTRVIVRSSAGTTHKVIPDSATSMGRQHHESGGSFSGGGGNGLSPVKIVQMAAPDLCIDKLSPVLCPKASELIVNYDEHVLVNSFKFGLVFQKYGQIDEEALFSNRNHSPAMEEFMGMMGRKVLLSEHKGYRGGLDTQYGQTGEETLYEKFQGREIMFHVSTLLPYAETDSQQLQRKRHIGNDIVAIIFQDVNTPFTPDMITSHFLHAFIVVQPIDPCTSNTKYKISVTARSDVPYFGPSLPVPAIFKKGPQLKEFLLTKLINAENACYKAERFSTLQRRTRQTLLSNLVGELQRQTEIYTSPLYFKEMAAAKEGIDGGMGAGGGAGGGGGGGGNNTGFISSVKKALTQRSKSQGPPEGRFMKISRQHAQGGLAGMKGVSDYHSSLSSSSGVELISSSTLASLSSASLSSTHVASLPGNTRMPMRIPQLPPAANKSNNSGGDSGHGDSDHHSVSSSSGSPALNSTNSSSSSRNGSNVIVTSADLHHHHRGTLEDSEDGSSLNSSIDPIESRLGNALPSPPPTMARQCSNTHQQQQQYYGEVYINGTGRPHHNHRHLHYGPHGVVSMHAPVGFEMDPECQNVVSGPVTMITLEGGAAAAAAAAAAEGMLSPGAAGPVDRLQEIARLRLDKLELLRQNVSARHEVRRLRERETQLQADLASASREIRRLRDGIRAVGGGGGGGALQAGGGGAVAAAVVLDGRRRQSDIKRGM